MNHVYIVAFFRTTHNEAQWQEALNKRVESNLGTLDETSTGPEQRSLKWKTDSLQRAFDDPVEASAFAMENDWYPFTLEKIPYGQPEAGE